MNPLFLFVWLALAILGGALATWVAGALFIYVGLTSGDWLQALAVMVGCMLAGGLMVWEACK